MDSQGPIAQAAAWMAALALAAGARGQTQPCEADCPDPANREVAERWAGQTGEPVPQVRVDADGTRRLEWHGSIGVRGQRNRVTAGGPGAANTATPEGSAGVAHLQAELRLPELDGSAYAAQFALQGGSDRSALPNHRTQVQNLALSYQGPTTALQFGDYAANFSQLGLQLGYRGAYAHREQGGLKAAVIAGAIAESWEALANRPTLNGQPTRSRYVREVTGLYLGRDVDTRWRGFVSLTGWRDQPSSLTEDLRRLPAAAGRTLTLGLQYRAEAFNASLEWARSRTRDDREATAQESGGLIADAGWRFAGGQLRAGLRHIGMRFSSASGSVQPGFEEAFVAADWSATAWLQPNGDLRRTSQRTAISGLVATGRNEGLRAQLGANASLNAWLVGLSLSTQASLSDQKDPAGQRNRQAQTSATLSWQQPAFQTSLSLTASVARTPAQPQMDSDSQGLQAQLGLPFGNERPLLGFIGQLSLSAGLQNQTLFAQPGSSRNASFGISLQARREGLAQFNLALQEQLAMPAQDGPRLRQRQIQFDAQRSLGERIEAKAFLRWAWRNLGDPALLGRERSIGAEIQTRW